MGSHDDGMKTIGNAENAFLRIVRRECAAYREACLKYKEEYEAGRSERVYHSWRESYASWLVARRILLHGCDAMGLMAKNHLGLAAPIPPEKGLHYGKEEI